MFDKHNGIRANPSARRRDPLTTRASPTSFNLLVLLYGLSLPFESITIWKFGTLPYLPAAGMVALAFWRAIRPPLERDTRLFRPLFIVGPVALASVSALWTIDTSLTLGRIVTLMGLALVSIAIVSTGDEASLRNGLYGLVLGGAVSAVIIVENYSQRSHTLLEIRVTAVDANANDLAGMAAAAGVVAIALSVSSAGRIRRIAFALAGLATLAGVFFTASRGPLLSALAGLVAVLVIGSKNRVRLAARILVITVSAILLMRWIDPRITERLATTIPAISNGDFNSRQDFWLSGIQIAADRPLTGWGAGTFVAALSLNGQNAAAAHSGFVDVLAETGILGLILLLGAFGAAAWAALNTGPARLALTALLVVVFVNCIDLTWDYRKITWFALGLCFLAGKLSLESHHGPQTRKLRAYS